MDNIELLETNANQFVELALNVLPAFAVVGLIAMAIVELLKVLPVKFLLYKYLVVLQFGNSKHMNTLLERLTGGAPLAFFMQRPQDITEQIASQANYMLCFPDVHNKPLIQILANNKNELKKSINLEKSGNESGNEAEAPTIAKLINGLIENFEPADMEKIQAYEKCKELLAELIKTNLTVLKNRMVFWWTFILQSSAIIISAALIGYFLLRFSDSSNHDTFTLILFVLLGGLVAPVSHDLIKKIKNRQQ